MAQPRKKATRPRFFPCGRDDRGDIEAERPAEGGEDPLHLGQDAGEKPVDPETANGPLHTEALVEPGGQEGGLHQGRRGEHPLEDEVAEESGGQGRGVEALFLAPAEFHDRPDADPRGARRRAGLAVQAEERLLPDGRGEFQPSFRHGAGQGRAAPGAGPLPVGQGVGGTDRQTEAAAHALQDRFITRGVGRMEIARGGRLRHGALPESGRPKEMHHR